VLYIILLEVASKLSRFCKMARRLKVVGPHCLTCKGVFTQICASLNHREKIKAAWAKLADSSSKAYGKPRAFDCH